MPNGINIKLDVTKLAKEHFFHGKQRADGSKSIYVDLVLWENDGPDQYGNGFALQQSLPKEARQRGLKGNYCGSGNRMMNRDAAPSGRQGNGQAQQRADDQNYSTSGIEEEDSLPF